MPRVLLEIKLHNKCQVSVSCFHSLSCIFLQFFENTFLGVGGCLLFGKENVFLPHTKAFFLRCLQMPRKWYMLNTQLKATQVSGNWPEVIQKIHLIPWVKGTTSNDPERHEIPDSHPVFGASCSRYRWSGRGTLQHCSWPLTTNKWWFTASGQWAECRSEVAMAKVAWLWLLTFPWCIIHTSDLQPL